MSRTLTMWILWDAQECYMCYCMIWCVWDAYDVPPSFESSTLEADWKRTLHSCQQWSQNDPLLSTVLSKRNDSASLLFQADMFVNSHVGRCPMPAAILAIVWWLDSCGFSTCWGWASLTKIHQMQSIESRESKNSTHTKCMCVWSKHVNVITFRRVDTPLAPATKGHYNWSEAAMCFFPFEVLKRIVRWKHGVFAPILNELFSLSIHSFTTRHCEVSKKERLCFFVDPPKDWMMISLTRKHVQVK